MATSEQKRAAVVAAYAKFLNRNIYKQALRCYCLTPYKDGRYYSDCSSSVSYAYKAAGYSFGILTTAGIYNNLKKVDVTISNGQITSVSKLRCGDLLLFRGRDAARPKYIGHVEMVASVGVTADKCVLYGHPSDKPRAVNMRDYCYIQQGKTVTRTDGTTGNRGLVCVMRYIQDDGSEKTPDTTFEISRNLKEGCKGDDVKVLQNALIINGYSCGTSGADGDYGTATKAAVKKFQKDKGLTADGIAGEKTITTLGGIWSGSISWSVARLLKLKQPHIKGDDVKALQSALNKAGYSCGKVDGDYGTATKTAVTNYQKAKSLTADGIAGKKTVEALGGKWTGK